MSFQSSSFALFYYLIKAFRENYDNLITDSFWVPKLSNMFGISLYHKLSLLIKKHVYPNLK